MRICVLAGACVVLLVHAARASFHIMDINEVYTNADGSVQYVELIARANFQTELQLARVVAHNASGSTVTVVVDLTTRLSALDNGETVLIATAAFEAVAGFAPDYVIPDCARIPFPNGRIIFRGDAGQLGDSVAYGLYTGSNSGFGTPADPLPDDGVNSITRVGSGQFDDNSLDFDIRPASPRRNDGTTVTFAVAPLAPDCDASSAADACEIAAGTLADDNDNSIADVCENRGDFDGDGDVDLDDYASQFACLDGPDGGLLTGCDEEDLNNDETVDFLDFAEFFKAFGTPPP